MRVLLALSPERAHFLGMVPLAWALRSRGHEVLVASQPELEGAVLEAGLPFVSVGRDHRLKERIARISALGRSAGHDFDWAERDESVLTWEHLLEGYRGAVPWWLRLLNEPMAGDLFSLCRHWRPDLVVWETTTLCAPVAAEAFGAAHARFVWSLDLLAQMRAMFLRRAEERGGSGYEDPLRDWISQYADRYGVPFSETLTRGMVTIEQTPEPLAVRGHEDVRYLSMRYVPYNGRASVPSWLRTPPERPRICLSLGTSAKEWFQAYSVPVQEALRGLGRLDAEVVATIPRGGEEVRDLPSNVRVVDFVSLHTLVPSCSAVVNQGGPGTVFTSLASAVPQGLIPRERFFDAPLLARRVEEAGAGLVLEQGGETADSLEALVRRLLSDEGFSERSAELRDRAARMDSPSEIARQLEELARERGTSGTGRVPNR